MKKLLCLIRGHKTTAVHPIGLAAKPQGILPSIDGYVMYESDPNGRWEACMRCRKVLGETK